MKHIFYFITILFVIYELIWIFNPKEQADKSKNYTKLNKENKGKDWDDMGEDYKSLLITKGLWSVIMILWMLSGLLTFNWIAFLAFNLFQFGIIAPISKMTSFGSAYTALHWFNSIIGLFFGMFIIINSYHLKIDLLELLTNYFK